MMRMTYARFKQFYENVDMKMIRSIWSPWQKELGATAMKTETMPWQRPGSDNSLSDRCKRRCGCAEHAKDGGVIPITGFPRVDGMANEEEHARINLDMVQTYGSSHTTYIHPRVNISAVIPLKREFRSGSSSTKEVVVHGP